MSLNVCLLFPAAISCQLHVCVCLGLVKWGGGDAFDDINPTFETSYQKRPIIRGKGSEHTNKLCYGFDALSTVCYINWK